MPSFNLQQGLRTLQQAAGLPSLQLEDLFESVTVESAWGPRIYIEKPLHDDGSPPTGWLKLLKPKVTLKFREPIPPLTIMPAGEPGESKFEYLAIGVAFGVTILGSLAAVGVASLLERKRVPRLLKPAPLPALRGLGHR